MSFSLLRSNTSIGHQQMMPSTAFPSTSAGVIPHSFNQIPEGKFTFTIYSLIRDRKYKQVIKLLLNYIDYASKNRAGLSLLGYCYYMIEDFVNAAQCYETLIRFYPEVDDYRFYYAQCLYKIGQLNSALKVSNSIESKEQERVNRLKAAIKYEMNDLVGCKAILDKAKPSIDRTIDEASLLFKEGKVDEALTKYLEAQRVCGFDPELYYYIALCYYNQKQFMPALRYIAEVVENGIKQNPDLNVGLASEGVETRSVGNSQTLRECFLIEVFNLKASIEFLLKNESSAKEALMDMPPRNEEELDSVTLHNQALINMESNPSEGFEKLRFLLTNPDCPPETLTNIILLYLKYSYYDLAADLLAEFRPDAEACINATVLSFVDAILLKDVSAEEAYEKLDDIANEYIELLRNITKQVQQARMEHNDEQLKKSIIQYDETIELYIPVLMAQAKIYWDKQNYDAVEKIFQVEFCNDHDVWKLNVAHTLFMQDNKFKETITFYEPLVKKNYDNVCQFILNKKILDVQAIVLANLCVSYIMTSKNEEAENLMKHIEKEEERAISEDPTKQIFHLCIVNLVIGTLYCAKGNYEFGISRVIKSMYPFSKKLSADTWFYAKRCIVALYETMAKQMVYLKDSIMDELMRFLDDCDFHGKEIIATKGNVNPDVKNNTISYEARILKSHFIKMDE